MRIGGLIDLKYKKTDFTWASRLAFFSRLANYTLFYTYVSLPRLDRRIGTRLYANCYFCSKGLFALTAITPFATG